MSNINTKQTIARLLARMARNNNLINFDDKYIQALYLLQNELDHKVIHEKELPPEETYNNSNIIDLEVFSLTPPNYAYRLLEINNYVYLETKIQWVKVTEPVQLELGLKA